ncbi:sn-glycerol-3-phosphate import ATP-binding protein UgpC [Sebaldella termitidis]|uniref:ABC transporter related protein n=2 Tax=Sebaldella TaxID=32068 RepID=D1AJE3_SEBTE|nr:ABC transporter related protein [Sebaldella termitidis ATCC 33386]SUI24151.1 sn-glycerol-3-phosphate import ATP-binding protein UgpC [Sebaldella termitidis]
MKNNILINKTIDELLKEYPFLEETFEENLIDMSDKTVSLGEALNKINEFDLEDRALTKEQISTLIENYVDQMSEILGLKENIIEKLTLLPGTDKSGNKENFEKLEILKGEILCIVGPTGSGKSRLLADIEWTAQGDTPTKRHILINDENVDTSHRLSSGNKMVAQLSQNMNFIMDLSVYEFLELHAASRMVEDKEEIINRIIENANNLAGEKFTLDTPVTSLSGGQSRALMISDTAILSSSPIVLIDEIENAGIDRKKALELLVGEEKIVLMATHDPLLALMGNKRIVINNGGIKNVIETSDDEKEIFLELEEMDKKIQDLRKDLRYGKKLKI